MKKQELTKQEMEIWNFIVNYLSENHEVPLRTELANAFQISPQLMQYRLRRMTKKGWIELILNKKRNIIIK